MSQIRIGDGTGCGYLTKVDADNNLRVRGVSEHQVKAAAKAGNAYGFGISSAAIPANNVPVLVWYQYIEDSTKNFHLDSVVVSWNGGNTNYNRPLLAPMYMGTTPPSANHTPDPMGNMNVASPKVALATGLKWNGVGTGMTVAQLGQPMASMYFSQGTTTVNYNGGLIIPKGLSLSMTLSSPEAGLASVFLGGWFEE